MSAPLHTTSAAAPEPGATLVLGDVLVLAEGDAVGTDAAGRKLQPACARSLADR